MLSPANISTLITSNPSLAETLKPLLPPDLGLPESPSAQDLVPVLTAPQFSEAVGSLDDALRNGGLPPSVLRELGLPETAGQSVKAFLEALQGLKRGENDDKMEQD